MNKEQTQRECAAPLVSCYPSANVMQYTAKVSAERGNLEPAATLSQNNNSDAKRHREKKVKREEGERVYLQVISNFMTV